MAECPDSHKVVPDEGDLLVLADQAIAAQQALEKAKQLRRFKANLLRTEANKMDADTSLGVHEYNEIAKIPQDLHAVQPPADDNSSN